MTDFRVQRIIRGSEVGRPPPLVPVQPSRRISSGRRGGGGIWLWIAVVLLVGFAVLAWARADGGQAAGGLMGAVRAAPVEPSR